MEAIKNRAEFTYRCRICNMENSHTKMTQTDIPVTKSGDFYRGIGLTSSGNLLTVSGGAYFELSDGSYFELDASTTTYGNYTAYSDSMYTATSIGFVAASGDDPAYLTDSAYRFGDEHFQSGSTINIATTSGTNDGDYTIGVRAVSRGKILLAPANSLTTENAATAGSVVLSRIIFKPNISTGCPFCGSMNSR